MAMPNSRRGKHGMTLLEVILACGIFALIMILSIRVLANDMHVNRLTAMQVAANAAIRAQIEELMTVSRDNIGNDNAGNMAKAAILYYVKTFKGKKICLGSNGSDIDRVTVEDGNKLVYRFGLPEPGDSARQTTNLGVDPKGTRVLNGRAVGQVIIYLTELDVEPACETDAEWNVMWKDIGTGNPDIISVDKGFDLNRDGKINNLNLDGTTRGTVTLPAAENPKANLDILQVPVDIVITFFTDTTHRHTAFEMKRRVIVM